MIFTGVVAAAGSGFGSVAGFASWEKEGDAQARPRAMTARHLIMGFIEGRE